MMKSLKFWQNWFHRAETVPAVPVPNAEVERKPLSAGRSSPGKPPSHVQVRAALRQRQRQSRNPE